MTCRSRHKSTECKIALEYAVKYSCENAINLLSKLQQTVPQRNYREKSLVFPNHDCNTQSNPFAACEYEDQPNSRLNEARYESNEVSFRS